MVKIAMVLAFFVLSSCVIERTVVDSDDMYVWSRRDVPTYPYKPRNYATTSYEVPNYYYFRPFSRPMWYSYPYWNQPSTVIIVPKQENNLQPGKRPSRESLPNHNRNQITPRRGRN